MLQKLERFAAELEALALEASVGFGDSALHLNTHRLSMCDNVRTGGLPPFEKALWAMIDGRQLDPCGYDSRNDYAAILNNVPYQAFQNRRSYDSAMSSNIGTRLRDWSAVKRQCFLDLIKRAIISEP